MWRAVAGLLCGVQLLDFCVACSCWTVVWRAVTGLLCGVQLLDCCVACSCWTVVRRAVAGLLAVQLLDCCVVCRCWSCRDCRGSRYRVMSSTSAWWASWWNRHVQLQGLQAPTSSLQAKLLMHTAVVAYVLCSGGWGEVVCGREGLQRGGAGAHTT